MSVKTQVLAALEAARGRDLSGQELAEGLGVSRAAVWKAIGALREEGYPISAANNKGYRLDEASDLVSPEGIRYYLPEEYRALPVYGLKSVDSTNNYAKRLMLEGAPHGTVIVADTQTAGRGRHGKSFYSPPMTGLYLSLILRPRRSLADALPITIAAALAVCQAAENLTGLSPRIKWVNDVFYQGKKICGILCEAVSDVESGMLEGMVAGIGVNLRTTEADFGELSQVAGSLFPERLSRNQLAAEIAARLLDLAKDLENPGLVEEYKKRSLVLGRQIVYSKAGQRLTGFAYDINAAGNLLIRESDGNLLTLTAGEVSIGSDQFSHQRPDQPEASRVKSDR